MDVAISFARPISLLAQTELAARLEAIVGREIDLVDLDAASTVLRWEVARQGIPIWAKEPGDVVEFRARVPLEYFDLQPFLEREAAGLRRVLERARRTATPGI